MEVKYNKFVITDCDNKIIISPNNKSSWYNKLPIAKTEVDNNQLTALFSGDEVKAIKALKEIKRDFECKVNFLSILLML